MQDNVNSEIQGTGLTNKSHLVLAPSKASISIRLLVVFLLGFSSGLPFSLIGSTLQAWFASEGQGLFLTASLSLLGFPYIIRFLWSPLLDKFSIFSLGRRRGWIIGSQLGLLLGFYGISYLSVNAHPILLIFIGIVLAVLSATQDSAIEAQRVEYLPPLYFSLGASLASTGYRLGILFSGGYALIMAQSHGWAFTYRTMAVFMLVGLIAALFSEEPKNSASASLTCEPVATTFRKALISFFTIPNLSVFIGFIFFYKLGEVFTSTISGIVMPFFINELHFSLSTIGYVNKVAGTLSLIVGGLIAGVAALRYSLASLLLVFGLIQALTNTIFVILAWYGPSLLWFIVAVVSDNLATGMGSTVLVVLLMRIVDKNYTATQFSLLIAFSALPRIVSGPVGAWMQLCLGWVGMYLMSVLLALLFIPFWFKIRSYPQCTLA